MNGQKKIVSYVHIGVFYWFGFCLFWSSKNGFLRKNYNLICFYCKYVDFVGCGSAFTLLIAMVGSAIVLPWHGYWICSLEKNRNKWVEEGLDGMWAPQM